MADIRYDSPLKLPNGWNSTPPSARSFNTSFPRTLTLSDALRFLEDEVRRFPFTAATIYTNFQHVSNDRLRKKVGNDTAGVSLMIKCYGREHMIACDHWQLTEQNAYAIHLALRAVRNFEEWAIATQSYALSLFSGNITTKDIAYESEGRDALPQWMQDLGLGPTASIEDANAVYRRRAKALEGNEEGLLKLNQSIEEARRHLR